MQCDSNIDPEGAVPSAVPSGDPTTDTIRALRVIVLKQIHARRSVDCVIRLQVVTLLA